MSLGRRHAPGALGHGYTLCGDAEDGHQTGDAEAPVKVATPGQTVTCSACRTVINHVRDTLRGYTVQGGK